MVPVFAGKPSEFRGWIKAIEKYVTLAGLGAPDSKMVTFQRSRGGVGDLIGRHINDEPEEDWEELKRQLRVRFGEISDPHYAFALLQKCKQRREESVALFAERLQSVAEESFPDGMGGAVQRQPIGLSLDGLTETAVQMKLLRGDPLNFEEAVNIATREATFQKQFALRLAKGGGRGRWQEVERQVTPADSVHEPMEIVHARPGACYRCGRLWHVAKKCRTGAIQAVQRSIVCYFCREQGHIKRDCSK